MNNYTVQEDGKLSDETINRTIERLYEDVSALDHIAVEAHMALSRASGVFRAALASEYESLGFSVPRLNSLRLLYHADGYRMTITELSAYLETSVPSTTHLVNALEEEGWVRRLQDEHDRRVTLVELTEAGVERTRALLPHMTEIWSDMWCGLSDTEKAVLSHLLAKFRLNLLSRYIGFERLLPYKLKKRQGRRPRRHEGK
ncbi:MAG TPA: MarR family transcriptional regulator [Dehalococcoidia bacterium]|nr:MarR family transcriptional regulator [Dehalococcoidia bacterium]